jgi:hydroxymethylpyrimidine/phosphomethylpyrimidine kinase
MLYDFATSRIVAETLQSCFKPGVTMPPLICDPVCISTSGQTILHQDAIEFMITRLFPMAALITPNKAEAEIFLALQGISQKIETLDDMLIATELLLRSVGVDAVLLKGGDVTATMLDVITMSAKKPDIQIIKQGLYGDNMEILLASHQDYSQSELVIDILHQASGEKTLFVHPRINSSNIHGTRCTLSSAIACEIALGCKCKYTTSKHFSLFVSADNISE